MKTSVLIPTINPAGNARRVIYNLAQDPTISIYILGDSSISSFRFSKYVSKYTYLKLNGDIDKWIETVIQEIVENDIQIVFPIDEEGIHCVIKHQNILKKYCDTVLLPSLDSFELVQNKRDMAVFCSDHHIEQPKYVFAENLDNNESYLNFPVITKDVNISGGGRGIKQFRSTPELKEYLASAEKTNLIIQEFIAGCDIDCSMLCVNGEIKAFTIQRGEDYGKSNFSYPISVKFLKSTDALKAVAPLMKSLNWNGIAHVDMRYNPDQDSYKIVEVNPRYWATLNGSFLAGVNFPLRHLELSINGKSQPSSYDPIEFWSAEGFFKRLKSNPIHLLRFKFIWNSTSIRFILKDPKPWVYALLIRLKRKIRKSIRSFLFLKV